MGISFPKDGLYQDVSSLRIFIYVIV